MVVNDEMALRDLAIKYGFFDLLEAWNWNY
jgi:hypothetical protein